MLSTPQAIISCASPHAIVLALSIMACSPLAQSLLTVFPAIVVGNPAINEAIRATFRLSSPDWFAAPAITSSIALTSILLFLLTKDLITIANKSSGLIPDKEPPYLPIGVLTASIMYTVSIIISFY